MTQWFNKPKFIQIHENLYVRGHTRSVHTESMLQCVQDRKIKLILNVALINDPALHAAAACVGVAYQHRPLNDSRFVNVPEVLAIASYLAGFIEFSPALVHCDSGHNRSFLVAILALAKLTGRPTKDILEEVRKKQRLALKNRTFELFVLEEVYRYTDWK